MSKEASGGARKAPLFVPRDLDGFFGLFIDNLANLLIIVFTLKLVFKMPDWIVYGRVVPGAVLAILAGNVFYTIQARRLAQSEGRDDVTALPYGISTPIMFAYLFLVIGPVYWKTSDGVLAWKVGAAAAFVGGIIEFCGAFVGRKIRDLTPRAAMLGTLAGIAITFIAMKPALAIWEHPQIGFLPLAVILVGFVARINFPFRLPAGFVAIASGTALAWGLALLGDKSTAAASCVSVAKVSQAWKGAALHLPTPIIGDVLEGLGQVVPFLVVVLPMGIYNFLETMQNVESASAAGDEFDTRATMMADGGGTCLGALFGSCFPTTVYIGHPGWKAVGARQGYTLLNGLALFLLTTFGLLGVAAAIIPKEVAFCILLYIGLIIGAQAFQASPSAHAPAVVFAFLPHIANFVRLQVEGALLAAGTSAQKLGMAALQAKDVHYEGLYTLGHGAIVTGLLLGAMAAFLIDRKPLHAAGYAVVSAGFAFVGVIHAEKLAWAAAPYHALGYLTLAVFFAGLAWLYPPSAESPAAEGGCCH